MMNTGISRDRFLKLMNFDLEKQFDQLTKMVAKNQKQRQQLQVLYGNSQNGAQ
jgi:hypothetical protein